MHQRINTQPQTQLDIHLLNTYCILNTDNPKTERAIPPENREPKWLTDLVLGEPGQRKGTPEQRGGWGEGRVEAYTETASGDSLLLLSTKNLRYWEMKEHGTEQNDMGTN